MVMRGSGKGRWSAKVLTRPALLQRIGPSDRHPNIVVSALPFGPGGCLQVCMVAISEKMKENGEKHGYLAQMGFTQSLHRGGEQRGRARTLARTKLFA
jgi:hypothetical protein